MAYQRTARYDAVIADWLASREDEFPTAILMGFDKQRELSYGENPHQRAAYYAERGARTHLLALTEQLHGKALSFNNLLDLDAARGLLGEFELPACVIVKHNNPCGVAVAGDVGTAYQRARDCDPVSAYGGVIMVNRPVDAGPRGGARRHVRRGAVRSRLRRGRPGGAHPQAQHARDAHHRAAAQQPRRARPAPGHGRAAGAGPRRRERGPRPHDRGHPRAPTEAEWGDLLFAWRVAKHVKSNAIVLARDLATVGVGAGQMSRVNSVRLSLEKAQVPVAGSVLASDAFFPFADGPEAAISAGVPGDHPARRLDPRRGGLRGLRRRRGGHGRHRPPALPPLMPSWTRTIDIDASPAATWDLVGDPTSVPRWYTKYETADVEGGQRVLRNSAGGELVETLDDRDEERRRYSYMVISGAPVTSYHASFEVQEREGGGSRVVWTVDAEPSDPATDIEARLGPTQAEALDRMKQIVESGG